MEEQNARRQYSNPKVAAQLGAIRWTQNGEILINTEELQELEQDTRLVLYLWAMSGQRIANKQAFWSVANEFSQFLDPYQGGLRFAKFKEHCCTEVWDAAQKHRQIIRMKRLPRNPCDQP